MLHGLFGDADNLRALGTRLGAERPVHRVDLPGHGGRPATDPLDHDRLADAILEDLRRVAAGAGGSSVHLLGHSLGGKVAMTIAGRRDAPALASLAVLDIAPKAYPPHHAALIRALLALDLDALGSRREADAALAGSIPTPGVRAFLLKGLERAPAGAAGPAFRWRFDLERIARDYAHLAAAVPPAPPRALPALFLHGADGDYVDPIADAPAVLARFPKARLEPVAGAGHWLHAERPEAVAAAVERHLAVAEASVGDGDGGGGTGDAGSGDRAPA